MKRCTKCGETKAVTEFSKNKANKDGLGSYCKVCNSASARKYQAANREKVKSRNAKWRKANAARGTVCQEPQRCTKCGNTKPASEFHKNKTMKRGLEIYCKECTSIRRAEYYVKHKQERDAYHAQYAAKNAGKIKAKRAKYYAKNVDKLKAQNTKWRLDNPGYQEKWVAENREHVAKYYADNLDKARVREARRKAMKLGADGDATAEQIAARWEVYGDTCYICGGEAEATDHVIPLARGGSNWPANLRPICKRCNSRKHATWPYDFAAARMAAA